MNFLLNKSRFLLVLWVFLYLTLFSQSVRVVLFSSQEQLATYTSCEGSLLVGTLKSIRGLLPSGLGLEYSSLS